MLLFCNEISRSIVKLNIIGKLGHNVWRSSSEVMIKLELMISSVGLLTPWVNL